MLEFDVDFNEIGYDELDLIIIHDENGEREDLEFVRATVDMEGDDGMGQE